MIGHSNETIAVITQGLKSGDVVALAPLAPMSEEEKRQKFGSPPVGPSGGNATWVRKCITISIFTLLQVTASGLNEMRSTLKAHSRVG